MGNRVVVSQLFVILLLRIRSENDIRDFCEAAPVPGGRYWGGGGSRPNYQKVVPIALALGGQYKNGHVPLLSGSRPNSYVYTTVRRASSSERVVFGT